MKFVKEKFTIEKFNNWYINLWHEWEFLRAYEYSALFLNKIFWYKFFLTFSKWCFKKSDIENFNKDYLFLWSWFPFSQKEKFLQDIYKKWYFVRIMKLDEEDQKKDRWEVFKWDKKFKIDKNELIKTKQSLFAII